MITMELYLPHVVISAIEAEFMAQAMWEQDLMMIYGKSKLEIAIGIRIT